MSLPAGGAPADHDGGSRLLRLFSSALASQGVLSAASFAAGLLLIRHASDLQYGYFVLVSGALLLATSLQTAYIAPPMVNRMTRLDAEACGQLTGGLYRGQRRVVAILLLIALPLVLALWSAALLSGEQSLLLAMAMLAAAAALRREYFRMVLLAHRRAHPVLLGDLGYAALLLAGVLLASLGPRPALSATLAIAVAAGVASVQLQRSLCRSESWDPLGSPGILRAIAPLGAWSTAGAAIHWSFSQGYTWLVAGTLDVSAVAAIAAARLLVMPVNLLSTGIGSLLLPLSARWLHDLGAGRVLRRLVWLALAIAGVSLLYLAGLWLARDWVFETLLRKHFADRDRLLLLWSSCFLLMAVNQQLVYLPIVRERFRLLTALTLLCAVLGLSCSAWAIRGSGAVGAPLGILLGELVNTIGIVVLCLRELGQRRSMADRPATCDDAQTAVATSSRL